MHINELKLEHEIFQIFCDIVQIPSPSLHEEMLIEWISNFLTENNIQFELDNYKNIIIKIPPTDKSKPSILFSSHMDVVGDFSPVNIELNAEHIQTDKKRTLGADDKIGIACSLLFAKELVQNTDLKHGGLEVVLTRDEERGMTGILNLDFKKIKSKYVLVIDTDKLGQLLISGASYTVAKLHLLTKYGGHSGLNIHEENRLNASKLIAELITKFPQGVYYSDKTGTITSINIGTLISGDIQNTCTEIAKCGHKDENYIDYFMKNSVTNVINTEAQATYSIRSADLAKENELKDLLKKIVREFNLKHNGLAQAKIEFKPHLPAFEKNEDPVILVAHKKACDSLGIKQRVESFHAGAETHIYAQNTNSDNVRFSPYLLGVADVYNMHSCDEKVNFKTLLKGYNLLKELFVEYNA